MRSSILSTLINLLSSSGSTEIIALRQKKAFSSKISESLEIEIWKMWSWLIILYTLLASSSTTASPLSHTSTIPQTKSWSTYPNMFCLSHRLMMWGSKTRRLSSCKNSSEPVYHATKTLLLKVIDTKHRQQIMHLFRAVPVRNLVLSKIKILHLACLVEGTPLARDRHHLKVERVMKAMKISRSEGLTTRLRV